MKKILFQALMLLLFTATIFLTLASAQTTAARQSTKKTIEALITDLAKASTELPRNRDAKTILKFYARDHSDISDAEAGTFESMQKEISAVIEQINLGSPIGISAQVLNIKVEVAGEMAWATYDSQMKIGANGKLLEEINQKCTTIFKRYGAEWLIRHEHCSSPKASGH